jgi:probable HAF family extracellular repeat protein
MVGLGDLPGGVYESAAEGVSADGSVVVGGANSGSATLSVAEAFRWTAAAGMIGLGDLPGDGFSSRAQDVSGDGTIVAGSGNRTQAPEGFLWTEAGGMVGLGGVPGSPSPGSNLLAFSADGSTAVGSAGGKAARWTAATGWVSLGDPPGASASAAFGVSDDGSVVVGSGGGGWRWTGATGFESLGSLPGGLALGTAWAVSADGSIIVGSTSLSEGEIRAFIWDEAHGMRSLQDVLVASGVDLTGWTLIRAGGISADGRYVVGVGSNPSGSTEAFLVFIPEPSSLALASVGLATLALRGAARRRRRAPSSSTSR